MTIAGTAQRRPDASQSRIERESYSLDILSFGYRRAQFNRLLLFHVTFPFICTPLAVRNTPTFTPTGLLRDSVDVCFSHLRDAARFCALADGDRLTLLVPATISAAWCQQVPGLCLRVDTGRSTNPSRHPADRAISAKRTLWTVRPPLTAVRASADRV